MTDESNAAIWRRLIEQIGTLPTRPQNEVATQKEAAAYIRGFNACRDEALTALRACAEAPSIKNACVQLEKIAAYASLQHPQKLIVNIPSLEKSGE